MSLGAVISCERATSAALQTPVAEAQAYVKKQPVKNADETSGYEGVHRKKVWLWVACTQRVTVFLIRASRGTQIAKDLLGDAFGVLVTDRWCAYTWWPLRGRQLCWAHLKRHFQAFAEAGGKAGRIGRALLREGKRLFEGWHRVRDGTLQHSTFRAYVAPLKARLEALLRQGSRCGHGKTEGTRRALLKLAPTMWTFVRRFLQTPPHGDALALPYPSPPPGWERDVHPLSQPACPARAQERFAGSETARKPRRGESQGWDEQPECILKYMRIPSTAGTRDPERSRFFHKLSATRLT